MPTAASATSSTSTSTTSTTGGTNVFDRFMSDPVREDKYILGRIVQDRICWFRM